MSGQWTDFTFTFTIFHSPTCYCLPSPSVCVTMPDRIQGVWLGQIGHHELLRDEDGSWICRCCSFSFQRKIKQRKTQASEAFWHFWLLFSGTFRSSCVWFFLFVASLSGFKLTNNLFQLIILRYTEDDMTVDFDNFVTCLVRLETMYSEYHTFNVFKGTVHLLL